MMRKKLPADQAHIAQKSTEKSRGWQVCVLATTIAVSLGLFGSDAHALALGRITVQSALGEPLRAEIDIPDINAEEAASLRATVASPDAFRAAGLEYNTAVSSLQVSLQRRPDGRSYLRLSSDRAISDPFLDLILEANWSSGRIVRDYTMLFDPANTRQPATVQPTAPQISAAPPLPTPAQGMTPRATPAPATTSRAVRPLPIKTEPSSSSVPSAPRATAKASSGAGNQLTVNQGATAGKIAAANKPDNVSLDQMLVALLRANPQAFIGGNVNRMKAGSVLDLPGAEQAAATPASEATKTIIAQSRDFNEFRRNLAEGVPTTQMAAADRKAGGKLQANVEDKKPATTSPDKLTLSKGTVQGKVAEEKAVASQKAKDADARVAELSKNISELSKLEAASNTAGSAPVSAASAAKSGVAVAVDGASPAASAAVAAAPAVVATTASRAASAATAPEPGFMSDLLENPMVPVAAGGLIALLAGFGFYRARQRKKAGQVDSSFLESRIQPDSFLGASGGQRVDTSKAAAPSSSMMYSPSQLDAAGDVDPVAEADVYLAYGRDLQAEEILKEAVRTNPSRVAIHGKLLEIYAKRRDVKTFEVVATEAYNLTAGDGPEWEQVCRLGQDLDPANPLYQPGGYPPSHGSAAASGKAASDYAVSTMPRTVQPALPQSPVPIDLDLDLDFSAGDEAPVTASRPHGSMDMTPPVHSEPTVTINAASSASVPLDMDFSAATSGFQHPVAAAASAPAHDSGMIEFDLNSLSLDLETPATGASQAASSESPHDPLATKLALAEEFRTIGDSDGARALAEEVIAQASGSLKVRAQQLIAELG